MRAEERKELYKEGLSVTRLCSPNAWPHRRIQKNDNEVLSLQRGIIVYRMIQIRLPTFAQPRHRDAAVAH
jgi:hypothetical protein